MKTQIKQIINGSKGVIRKLDDEKYIENLLS